MRYFDLNGPIIRKPNNEGQLQTAGYQWAERVEDMFPTFAGISALLLVWAVLCLFDREVPFIFTAKLIAAGLGAAAIAVLCATKERAVVFERNGEVRFPYGTTGKSFRAWCYYRGQHEITSIEVMPHIASRHTFYVALLTVHGETCIVSANLSSAHARLVAVQLTRALNELRQSMATVDNFAAPRPAGQAAPAWIE